VLPLCMVNDCEINISRAFENVFCLKICLFDFLVVTPQRMVDFRVFTPFLLFSGATTIYF
ncbi:MAG: hypothetical protein RR576_12420, partial [Oscillospiraceae bacterium]